MSPDPNKIVKGKNPMKAQRVLSSGALALLLSLMFVTSALAGTVSENGIKLTYPSYPLSGPGLQSCAPWEEPTADTITLIGITEGATVIVTFAYSNPYDGSPQYQPSQTFTGVQGDLKVPVAYPQDTTQWYDFNSITNERAIAVSALVQVINGNTVKLASKQWWVRCVHPQPPFQGCTPGYWRQPYHLDSWIGYTPGDSFGVVFGVNPSFTPSTLLDAVQLGGGGESALARHAVAALLNAADPSVNYYYTTEQVLAGVQQAYATENFELLKEALDFANNADCLLN
jgi:hypothetical protein